MKEAQYLPCFALESGSVQWTPCAELPMPLVCGSMIVPIMQTCNVADVVERLLLETHYEA